MDKEVTDEPAHDAWGVGWDARRREQMTLGLKVSPAERLAWLEGMIELAHRMRALPRRNRDPWRGPGGR